MAQTQSTTQLTPAAAARPAIPAARLRAVELALEARAPATRRAYKSALARLGTWLDGRALTDATLADHVAWLAAQGLAPASIGQAVAAACFLAEVAGWQTPRGSQTKDALRIVRREHADRGRGQAPPVTAEQVAEIIAVARAAGRIEDAAIAGLLFQGALRRSEVATLEWQDIEDSDLPAALRIRVRRSKTNQAGAETDVRLVKNGAAAALRALRLDTAGAETDKVFGGLCGRSIGRRFAAAAAKAGVQGVTAHSGRVGHASELTARGASTTEVMLSGGWKTARMVAHYAAGAKADRGAVAKYL